MTLDSARLPVILHPLHSPIHPSFPTVTRLSREYHASKLHPLYPESADCPHHRLFAFHLPSRWHPPSEAPLLLPDHSLHISPIRYHRSLLLAAINLSSSSVLLSSSCWTRKTRVRCTFYTFSIYRCLVSDFLARDSLTPCTSTVHIWPSPILPARPHPPAISLHTATSFITRRPSSPSSAQPRWSFLARLPRAVLSFTPDTTNIRPLAQTSPTPLHLTTYDRSDLPSPALDLPFGIPR